MMRGMELRRAVCAHPGEGHHHVWEVTLDGKVLAREATWSLNTFVPRDMLRAAGPGFWLDLDEVVFTESCHWRPTVAPSALVPGVHPGDLFDGNRHEDDEIDTKRSGL
jgi:hypothetical protein